MPAVLLAIGRVGEVVELAEESHARVLHALAHVGHDAVVGQVLLTRAPLLLVVLRTLRVGR